MKTAIKRILEKTSVMRKRGSGDTIGTVSISPFWLGVGVIALTVASALIVSVFTSKNLGELQKTVSQAEIEQMSFDGIDVIETAYLDKDTTEAAIKTSNSGSGVLVYGTNIQDFSGDEGIGVLIISSIADVTDADGVGGDDYESGSNIYDNLDVVLANKYIISITSLEGVNGLQKLDGNGTDGKVVFKFGEDAAAADAASDTELYVYKRI